MSSETKKTYRTLLLENGNYTNQAPVLPPSSCLLVAIHDIATRGAKRNIPEGQNSDVFLYPTKPEKKRHLFSFVEELIKARKTIINTFPDGFGYLAVLEKNNGYKKSPILNIIIPTMRVHSISEYKRIYPYSFEITSQKLEAKGIKINNAHALIVNVPTSPGKTRKWIFDFGVNDNTIIIDPKTAAILYAGAKAIRLYPELGTMTVHKRYSPASAQQIATIAESARLFRETPRPPRNPQPALG